MPTPRRFSFRFSLQLLLGFTTFLYATARPIRVQAAIDAATVQQSIDRGVAYLRSTQEDRGSWKEYTGQNGGLTALCTLALLTAGVAPDDPAITKSLQYLRKIEPSETYSVALQTLVLCEIGAASDLVRIRRNVAWLEQQQVTDDTVISRNGGWGYGGGRSGGDPSNSQFALLALDAAEQRGVPVTPITYERAAKYWSSRQTPEGGWAYGSSETPAGSMTCAGIASAVICRGRLNDSSSRIENGEIKCCGGSREERDPVEAGLNWLGERFSVQFNPGGGTATLFYYLYALERVGRMTGRRLIGGHDWYREGSRRLIETQDGFQGFWSGFGNFEGDRNVTTSFALLFLAKGKRQVAIGRLRYGNNKDRDDGPWNEHPDASRQLVRRLERNWGRDLTWQTITTDNARVEDLLQAPLIVISGKNALDFSIADQKLLKDYLDQGGSLLFDASAGAGCGSAAVFEKSVRDLCATWFPSAPLGPLPPSHPVYSAEADVKPELIGPAYQLSGVEACCRTAVFYSPLSLTCRWELSDPTGRNTTSETPRAVKDSLETAARLGQNILAYATGRELKDKLDAPMVIRESDTESPNRGAIRIARLQIDAGARDARRSLPNFIAIASKRVPIHLEGTADELPIDAKVLSEQAIVWLHGRTDFQLSPDQRRVLREFLENDGMIIADSICGSPEFTAAIRRELAEIIPQSPLQTMPPDHPAMSARYGGYDLRDITTRTPSRGNQGTQVTKRRGTPQLEFAMVNGAALIFFSPLDLSCALESQNSIQCPGYDTNDSTRIAINLILYALQQ